MGSCRGDSLCEYDKGLAKLNVARICELSCFSIVLWSQNFLPTSAGIKTYFIRSVYLLCACDEKLRASCLAGQPFELYTTRCLSIIIIMTMD